jgi:hypothetical protein
MSDLMRCVLPAFRATSASRRCVAEVFARDGRKSPGRRRGRQDMDSTFYLSQAQEKSPGIGAGAEGS